MSKQYDLVSTINGYTATHVRDGIYKVETPFRINIDEWTHDESNYNYTILGANYSTDYSTCEIHYFTKEPHNKILILMNEINGGDPDKYGYIQCLRTDMPPRIGGGIIFGI